RTAAIGEVRGPIHAELRGARLESGGLHVGKVRVLRLIEIEAGPEVITKTGVHRQARSDVDVVLEVGVVLLDRRRDAGEAARDDDLLNRRTDAIFGERVLTGRTNGEVTAEGRLVDVLQSGLEIVTAPADLRGPAEVVLQLMLLLHRRLRRVRALSLRCAGGIEDVRIVG